jgi:hypothetical protein
MRIFVSLVFASLNLTLAIVPAYTQQQEQNSQERNSFRVRLETPGGSSLWNDSRSELIVGNSHRQGDRSTARVDIYNVVSGEKRSIDILKEFPNARYVYVEGLAVSPEGSILVACEVDSNEAAFAGDRLLLYDRHSALTTSLLAGDYDVGAVALDRQSNMYILGSHDGELSSKEPYPLLVKYDSYGHITSQMLPRSLFTNFEDPVGDGISDPRRGATRLAVNEKAIHVYLAPASEMVVLNQTGEIQTRVNVARKLSEFAETKGYKAFRVDGDEFSPSGDLWFVGVLAEPSNSTSAMPPARNFVVRLTPAGQLQVPYKEVGEESPGQYLPQLIGFTQSNEPVGSSSVGSDYFLVQKGPY